MKYFVICISFLMILASTLFAQAWEWQDPMPQGNNLNAIKFIDANYGWVTGASGAILRTTNGGSTWTTQTSGTTNYLWGLAFSDVNNGWAWASTSVQTSN